MGRFVVLLVLAGTIIVTASYFQGSNFVGAEQLRTLDAGGGQLNKIEEIAPHVPGELLVKFHDDVTAGAIERVNRQFDAKILKRFRITGAYHLAVSQDKSIADVVAAYNELAEVEYAEPNFLYFASVVPNDPSFSNLWGMTKIHAPAAWDLETGDSSIVVAVIDTGLDYSHPDIVTNVWFNNDEIMNNGIDDDGNGYVDDIRGWNFIAETNNPYDDNMHGTHTSGTIGAVGNNGVGVVGVCWDVSIMPLKFLDASGSGSTDDAVEAIEYATENGAAIMSNSWGGGGYSQTMYAAIAAANDANILFVAAAGNSYMNNDYFPSYPASYDLANIISVAATDSADNKALFSNFGLTSVDLGAPGVGIYSTVPDNGYSSADGTSMACPMVSGAAALVWASHPAFGVAEIKNRILWYTDVVPGLAGKCVTGGRLNAYRSVLGGLPNPQPTPGPTPSPCPFVAVAQGTSLSETLNTVRSIRDGQMARTEYGRRLIKKFQANSAEITQILFDHPELFQEAQQLLLQSPEIIRSIENGQSISFEDSYRKELLGFLDDLSRFATPGLDLYLMELGDLIDAAEGVTLQQLLED